jgi:hypothetical protein
MILKFLLQEYLGSKSTGGFFSKQSLKVGIFVLENDHSG